MGNNATTIGPGFFSKLDSIHVHVDGGGEVGPVQHIVDKLKEQGIPGKTTPIREAVAGPQREESWAIGTYISHTPGPAGQEHLEFFSTTLLSTDLGNMRGTIQHLNQILTLLFEQQTQLPPGIVVEVERVYGQGEDDIKWSKVSVDDSLTIHSPDAGFERHRTADIEIHYAFDIPREGKWHNVPPLDLTELKDACNSMGVFVGGWFLFEKHDKWAYRSNQFTRTGMEHIAQEQRNELNQYLQKAGDRLGFHCKARALVEQILGVWRTPLYPVDPRSRKSVLQLAEWEASIDLKEFWVIAPNFLGDTRGDVRQAMIQNLRKRVDYVYFLRSFADVQRLRNLAEMLEPDVRGNTDIFKHIKAVLLESFSARGNDVFDEEYFIANPNAENREGYRLLRTGKGEIYAGERMTSSDFQRADMLAELMKAELIEEQQISHVMQIPLRRDLGKPKRKAITCVKLNETPTVGRRRQDWESVLGEFDQLVADNVSKLCGQVVKGSLASYFFVFDDVESALKCAERLQESVRSYNKRINPVRLPAPRVAVDFGHVNRVMRSYGFDFSGRPIGVCAKLVEQVADGEVLITKAVEDNLEPSARQTFNIVSPGTRACEEFGNVECRKLDWV